MKPFKTITAKAIPMWVGDIDTDMIIPAQFLTQTTTNGYGENLFKRLKEADPEFVFNQLCFKDARILLAGSNFGCGSSREHAVWALQQAGIDVIIAPSFSDIFFNNAAKNGLLLIELPADITQTLCEHARQGMLDLTVDLENNTVTDSRQAYLFDYDPFRRECLLKGQDDMAYLLAHKDKICAFEQQRLRSA
ncbi:3-isopropylmalate dehydratase small subunit [Facilibium subflavum]|uniref:3-isopropylmalate dehydratase small subunit n=1 Tax=Facilibium subflavum TaxID=2219058 RepID=UPI000E647F65|nr:3-isopropylmalate dehydratase small subunit [Facilibium subflavum]